MLDIYIDADACPVRKEVFTVAERHRLTVFVVTQGNIRVPVDPRIRLVLVSEGPDAADDWIAERIGPGDICVTADVPLASRCLKKGASAIGSTGRRFTADNIGTALASRDIAAHIRESGGQSGGPRPLAPRDRSRFLGELDGLINAIRRAAGCKMQCGPSVVFPGDHRGRFRPVMANRSGPITNPASFIVVRLVPG